MTARPSFLAARPRAKLSVGLALALAGCSLGPAYKAPALEIPAAYRATRASAAAAWPSETWWRGFNSPELDELIDAARTNNFDIQAAIARVRQADAQVRIAGSPQLPAISADGSASWSRQSLQGRGSSGSTQRTTSDKETPSHNIRTQIS